MDYVQEITFFIEKASIGYRSIKKYVFKTLLFIKCVVIYYIMCRQLLLSNKYYL